MPEQELWTVSEKRESLTAADEAQNQQMMNPAELRVTDGSRQCATRVEEEKNRRELAEGLRDTIRLWPHRLKGEGHYLAVLRKRDDMTGLCTMDGGRYAGDGNCGRQRGMSAKDAARPGRGLSELREFAAECLCGRWESLLSDGEEHFLMFGDQLYRMPDGMPSIAGLKVLRPGLHLGTIKKNRFEPSHALALASRRADVHRVAEFASDSGEIRRYLAGETLPCDGEKGWTLVTADGYAIGWGKAAGGRLKNHYPKGLRIM